MMKVFNDLWCELNGVENIEIDEEQYSDYERGAHFDVEKGSVVKLVTSSKAAPPSDPDLISEYDAWSLFE